MACLEYRVAAAPLGVLLLGVARLPLGAEAFAVTLTSGSTMKISIKPGTLATSGKPCYIVVLKRQLSTWSMKSGESAVFDFSCQNPERNSVIETEKNIDCTSGPCPFREVQLQPATSSWPTLNRTFIWDVKPPKNIGTELQFSVPYLRQVGPGESCPDAVTYSIDGSLGSTPVKIGTFCSIGTVSRIKPAATVV